MGYVPVKFPRILTSSARHKKLWLEAKKRNMTIEDVAEEKFSKADSKKDE